MRSEVGNLGTNGPQKWGRPVRAKRYAKAQHGPSNEPKGARRSFIEAEITELDSPAGYLHFGFVLISYPNLIVIGGMIVLFAIALLAPFHGVGDGEERP